MPMVISPGEALAAWGTVTTGDPEPMFITCGLDVSAAGGDTADILSSMVSAWEESIASITSSVVTLTIVQARIGQDGGDPIPVQDVVSVPGTDAGPLPPPNCAYLARKVTGLGGRKQQGRFYFPGIALGDDLDSGGNIITNASTYAGAVQLFRTELLTPSTVGAVSLPPLLPHGDGTTPWTPITSFLGQNKLATQRRRLRP